MYRLRDAVAIKSVSAWPTHRPEVIRMINWTKDWIEKLGGKAELQENPGHEHAGPMQKMDDGSEIPLPPILLGQFGNDPKKKTVCVYGHLDVQPAEKSDGWDTDPFELTEIDGKLFGRGATDDKGPALSWLWMVEAFQELKMELPVNIKIIYEGMEVRQEQTDSTTPKLWLTPCVFAGVRQRGHVRDVLRPVEARQVPRRRGLLLHLRQLLAREEQALHHVRATRHGILRGRRRVLHEGPALRRVRRLRARGHDGLDRAHVHAHEHQGRDPR